MPSSTRQKTRKAFFNANVIIRAGKPPGKPVMDSLADLVTADAAGEDGQILVVGRLKMNVEISYTHPDWENSVYDSEDKVRHAFDNVSGEKEVELEADFTMTILVDDDGKPDEIDHFSFSNDGFIWVEIEDPFEDDR
jgi:hypothetical protein